MLNRCYLTNFNKEEHVTIDTLNYSLIRKYVKEEWNDLWQKKIDDKLIAESISKSDYAWLEVLKGQIISANRQFNQLDLYDLLEKNYGILEASKILVDPNVGGWKKFAKNTFKYKENKIAEKKYKKHTITNTQQQRKNGEGWLNKHRAYLKNKRAHDVNQ